jgi:tetratricopeptide (TPR) repeat protein
MTRFARQFVFTLCVSPFLAPNCKLHAQTTGSPKSEATTVVRFADSVALAGNTAEALAQYKTALRAAPRSAELWYGFGLLNWQLATGGKTATSDVANSSRNRDYLRAFEYFRAAVAANSTSTRNSRHLYMALTECQRWAELLKLATTRANQYAFDAQARLPIGLAQHRLGQRALAQAAFDDALSMVGASRPVRNRKAVM